MKVKDILITALKFIGRDGLAKKLSADAEGDAAAGGLSDNEAMAIEAMSDTAEETAGGGAMLLALSDTLEEGDAPAEFTDEEQEVLETLLYCFNAVEDELARKYFPLRTEEVLYSDNGVYPFSGFKLRPVKIISVKSGGKNLKFTQTAQYLFVNGHEITVAYDYSPLKKGVDDESEFSSIAVNERLVAAGTASEYCLLDGEAKLAETWESVYRNEIESIQRTRFEGLRLPPRRWA